MSLDADRIRKAVAAAQAAGWRIDQGTYVRGSLKCCCPLGAFIVERDGNAARLEWITGDEVGVVAAALGVDVATCESFACGFDNEESTTVDREAWDLGAAFRRELLGGAAS